VASGTSKCGNIECNHAWVTAKTIYNLFILVISASSDGDMNLLAFRFDFLRGSHRIRKTGAYLTLSYLTASGYNSATRAKAPFSVR
jgi:hypothetical protein